MDRKISVSIRLTLLFLAGCPKPEVADKPPTPDEILGMELSKRALALPYDGPETVGGMPAALLYRANRGRSVIDASDRFIFPPQVRRVWVDIGAHELEHTLHAMMAYSDLGVIAVEPLSEKWASWPNVVNLVTIPFALFDEEGVMTFHVNAFKQTSSLLASDGDDREFGRLLRTKEDRQVSVFRLDRILKRIPKNLCIEFLKTDVQGVDLQVLKSGADELKRVKIIRAEVINRPIYDGKGQSMSGPDEFKSYLGGIGFKHVTEFDTMVAEGEVAWTNLEFLREEWPCETPPKDGKVLHEEIDESYKMHKQAWTFSRPLATSTTAVTITSSRTE
ncbi:MAG: FkbM family methyltransferase [Deltaproteobacteria bacterium]|nr:FkbM family methyltransferase [Deltaproteobacteria bacterium]